MWKGTHLAGTTVRCRSSCGDSSEFPGHFRLHFYSLYSRSLKRNEPQIPTVCSPTYLCCSPARWRLKPMGRIKQKSYESSMGIRCRWMSQSGPDWARRSKWDCLAWIRRRREGGMFRLVNNRPDNPQPLSQITFSGAKPSWSSPMLAWVSMRDGCWETSRWTTEACRKHSLIPAMLDLTRAVVGSRGVGIKRRFGGFWERQLKVLHSIVPSRMEATNCKRRSLRLQRSWVLSMSPYLYFGSRWLALRRFSQIVTASIFLVRCPSKSLF